MENRGFFKWIWRINAISILLICFAVLYSFIEHPLRDYLYGDFEEETSSTPLAEDPKGVEKWFLRAKSSDNHKKEYTLLSLVSHYGKIVDNPSYSQQPKKYRDKVTKNVLFINTKENSSSWLFKTNSQFILGYSMNTDDSSYYDKKEELKFIYYKIIDRDTNGDKIVTLEDKTNFAVSDISGKNYKVIIRNIEEILNMKMVEEDMFHMVYQKDNGIGYSLKLNTKKMEIVSNVRLPKVSEIKN